jgi:hypothetical protein
MGVVQMSSVETQVSFDELANFSEKQKLAHESVKKYKYVLYGGA